MAFTVLLTMVMTSCIHNDFEEPPVWSFPEGEVMTVAQLRSLFTEDPVTFQGDYSVYGTITMDDKSGNIYRSAYLEDATGAINLRMVAPGAIYRGDSVRLYLKGTTLGSYMRMLQLDNVNADRNIIKLAAGHERSPSPASITDVLSGNLQARLVRLDQVQFAMADVGKTFADSENLTTVNRTLEDCNGNRVVVRTSGYASFADQEVPLGSGSLVAVVAQYQNEMQLYIRSFQEVQMEGSRCPIPGDDYNLVSISALRQQFGAGNPTIPANTRIEGVVISDRANENHPGQNLFLMDESGAGITVRFSSFHSFPLGSRIRVIFGSPMPMTRFNGLLQIENVPGGNAYELGPGTLPQPVTLTVAQAISGMEQYQSTLIRITNVTLSGGPQFSQSPTLSDGTGQMMLYTHNWASFASNTIPSGTITITGILSTYNSPQLLIRNLNDISQ